MVSKLFQKLHLLIYANQLATSQLFQFPLILWNRKMWKGRQKNYENLNILRTKRAFWIKWKTFFIIFEMLSFDKIEKIKKIADTSFKLHKWYQIVQSVSNDIIWRLEDICFLLWKIRFILKKRLDQKSCY